MPVQIHLNGQRYFADDGTDPAELQQYAQMHQQEQAQLNPINQGMQNVFSGINRQIQNYNELPAPTAVPGNTYGMSTQAFNQTAGIIQQDNMNSATARMQQRVQMEQAMEQEKDRAQQIKLQETQFKNQQAMENFRIKQEEARLKREGMTPKPIPLAGGGIAEYTPGADGQQGTINTLREPAVKPVTKSYTTMYGNDGTAYGVNKADPSEVLVIKDPLTGDPIKRTAGQTGRRLVNDANGMPYMLDMATGAMDSVNVPEGFAADSPSQNNPELRDRRAFILRDVQNKENRYFRDYGSLEGFDRIAAEAEAAAAYERVSGAAGGAPAQGGGVPTNPPMAREGFVDGRRALINDATGEAVILDDPPAAAPVAPQQAPAQPPQQPLFDPFANIATVPQVASVPATAPVATNPVMDQIAARAPQQGLSPEQIATAITSAPQSNYAAYEARANELLKILANFGPAARKSLLDRESPEVRVLYDRLARQQPAQTVSTSFYRPPVPTRTF